MPASAQIQVRTRVTVVASEACPIRNFTEFTGRFETINHANNEAQVTAYLQSVAFQDEDGDLLFVTHPAPLRLMSTTRRLCRVNLHNGIGWANRAEPTMANSTLSTTVSTARPAR